MNKEEILEYTDILQAISNGGFLDTSPKYPEGFIKIPYSYAHPYQLDYDHPVVQKILWLLVGDIPLNWKEGFSQIDKRKAKLDLPEEFDRAVLNAWIYLYRFHYFFAFLSFALL